MDNHFPNSRFSNYLQCKQFELGDFLPISKYRSRIFNILMKEVWDWCHSKRISLSAEHLPGVWQSRNIKDSSNWSLNQDIFNQIHALMGPLKIGLFASRLNFKLKRFVSWKQDPLSFATDAFLYLGIRYRVTPFPSSP